MGKYFLLKDSRNLFALKSFSFIPDPKGVRYNAFFFFFFGLGSRVRSLGVTEAQVTGNAACEKSV